MSIKDIFSRNIVDKLKDVVDINKLTLKISGKKAEIGKLKVKLGEVVYDNFKEGGALPEEVNEILNTIKVAEEEIAELEEQIASLKTSVKTPESQKCPSCGAENSVDAKFCKECGVKLEKEPEKEPEEPTPPAKVSCPECGVENEPDAKFCVQCGYNLKAPAAEPAPAEPVAQEAPSGEVKEEVKSEECCCCGEKTEEKSEEAENGGSCC